MEGFNTLSYAELARELPWYRSAKSRVPTRVREYVSLAANRISFVRQPADEDPAPWIRLSLKRE